jgi:hypothetical protein
MANVDNVSEQNRTYSVVFTKGCNTSIRCFPFREQLQEFIVNFKADFDNEILFIFGVDGVEFITEGVDLE